MTEKSHEKKFTYMGAGFPVDLIGFPFKKIAGEEVLDVDAEKLDLAIARLVLLKPAFLTGREIRFLRHFLNESMSTFGAHFGISAAAVKKWEDLDDSPIGSVTNDFAIRNYLASRLTSQFKMHFDIAVHQNLLEAGQFWKPEIMEIPFEAMAKYARDKHRFAGNRN
jgi:hypothetical protein